ncbi:hypothetical protein DRQ09_03560 [candidate division KSB1 bacterium]|nr:MAG: hypothetical protein DRQ09_03560 [candidate division KSB1 bacterium]
MKKIIVADRDQELLKSMELYLREYYNVVPVKSETELLELINRENVDLVLSDLKISNGCPLTTFQNIKNVKPNLPVVIMYVYFDETGETEETIRKFVNAVIYKPFNIEKVKILIDNLLDKNSKIFNNIK